MLFTKFKFFRPEGTAVNRPGRQASLLSTRENEGIASLESTVELFCSIDWLGPGNAGAPRIQPIDTANIKVHFDIGIWLLPTVSSVSRSQAARPPDRDRMDLMRAP
jgi:hypothetical protein